MSMCVIRRLLLCLGLSALLIPPSGAADRLAIGLTTGGAVIEVQVVEATAGAPQTVVLLGGLTGGAQSAAAVRTVVASYEQQRSRPWRILAVAMANPEAVALQFPPVGVAYRDNVESHVLWRWLGTQAPDLVLIGGDDPAGLAQALDAQKVADMGRIPALSWQGTMADLQAQTAGLTRSPARAERDRRLARTPRQLAQLLARHYGQDFDQPWYIGAIALIARAQLGDVADVQRLVEPYVNGSKDSLARANSLVLAGHIVFTDLARRTGDSRYVAAVRKAGELGFDDAGQMRESMPYHEQYSDSVFMGTAIVAQAGALTGERRYFDMADRHLRFMQALVLRPDGLYRHQPATDAAWGRGNGFAALGLALTLSELPPDHPGYAHALRSYRALMTALLPWQTREGLWRNVIDHPGAYPEFSATAMIGFAIQRGLRRGWLQGDAWRSAVARAWTAVNARSSADGGFVDVCESTTRQTSLDQYLKRAAILGKDPRGGAMALQFATELMADGAP